jgi:ATP-dependent Lhr-like helicase
VTYIDWTRRHCFVEPADAGGKARWTNFGLAGLSFEVTRATRSVLLGEDPSVTVTRRAAERMERIRDDGGATVHPGGTLIARADGDVRWWTWAGFKANATLMATLGDLADPTQRFEERYVRLRDDLTVDMWRSGIADATERICLPEVSKQAVAGLKFSAALPERLAFATLAARLADTDAAQFVLHEPQRFAIL